MPCPDGVRHDQPLLRRLFHHVGGRGDEEITLFDKKYLAEEVPMAGIGRTRPGCSVFFWNISTIFSTGFLKPAPQKSMRLSAAVDSTRSHPMITDGYGGD